MADDPAFSSMLVNADGGRARFIMRTVLGLQEVQSYTHTLFGVVEEGRTPTLLYQDNCVVVLYLCRPLDSSFSHSVPALLCCICLPKGSFQWSCFSLDN